MPNTGCEANGGIAFITTAFAFKKSVVLIQPAAERQWIYDTTTELCGGKYVKIT